MVWRGALPLSPLVPRVCTVRWASLWVSIVMSGSCACSVARPTRLGRSSGGGSRGPGRCPRRRGGLHRSQAISRPACRCGGEENRAEGGGFPQPGVAVRVAGAIVAGRARDSARRQTASDHVIPRPVTYSAKIRSQDLNESGCSGQLTEHRADLGPGSLPGWQAESDISRVRRRRHLFVVLAIFIMGSNAVTFMFDVGL